MVREDLHMLEDESIVGRVIMSIEAIGVDIPMLPLFIHMILKNINSQDLGEARRADKRSLDHHNSPLQELTRFQLDDFRDLFHECEYTIKWRISTP